METKEKVNFANTFIPIQVNGEKAGRIQCTSSETIAELRKKISSAGISLPKSAQFLDADEYPVLLSNEKSLKINGLFKFDNDKIIHLSTTESSTNTDEQRSNKNMVAKLVIFLFLLGSIYYIIDDNNRQALVDNKICPTLIKLNISKSINLFRCPGNGTEDEPDIFVKTTTYLEDQIKEKSDGTEVLIGTKTGLRKAEATHYNEHYVAKINAWVENREAYKKDYEWYNAMKSTSGNCAGKFNERLLFSAKRIKNTSSSIQKFSAKAFESWPQALKAKIDMENELDGIENEDGGDTDYGENGKIFDNLYLVAWKRGEDDTIRIQTYVTIFERTAGDNCRFDQDYWSGQRERVVNAKKYFLLLKIESNPVYKEFLLRQSTHQAIE